MHPDGRRAYVACYSSETLEIVDIDSSSTSYLSRIASVDVGSRTQAVAITPDGERLVVGLSDGVLILDAEHPDDGPARAKVGSGGSSQTIIVTPDGGYAVVLSTTGNLILIDLTTNAELARAKVGSGGSSQTIIVSGDGGSVYVSDSEGATLAVFSITGIPSPGATAGIPHSWRLTGFEPLPTIAVGENPIGMAFDPVTGMLLVVNAGDPSVGIIDATTTSVAAEERVVRPSLSHARPNPSRGETSFMFVLPAQEHVQLRVYSVDGKLVRDVVSQRMPAGRHVVTWDGRTRSGLRAAAGVYFIEMRAGTWREHRKAILLR